MKYIKVDLWFTVLFVTLKIVGWIDWSWWWVVSPLWVSSIIYILLCLKVGWDNGRKKHGPLWPK